ncbi:N-acetylneuraminate synthase family protein [Gallaecimonas sp. GXIMD4217]|uniref:N-acetylneuraminate synthase family protein n=1 Tax=Gallaecimonas sp. GXIMD4217 TaxID=3131927 RepID=UPI00311B0108
MHWSREFSIGRRQVGDGHPAYIIAEIGSNHNQSLARAKELIEMAKEAGADAAKFQSLRYDKLYRDANAPAGIQALFRQIELTEQWHLELAEHCRRLDIDFFSAPTYPEAVDWLQKAGAEVIKVASPQFGLYPEVLDAAINTGKPLIMSAGLSGYGEIEEVLRHCQRREARDLVLLHCVSQYPTPPANGNLRVIQTLRQAYGCLTGYSDHTLGIHFPIAAVALGACVIEKHFTPDRNLPGPDHHFAIEPQEFKAMVQGIRDIEVGLGDGIKAPLSDWERQHRENITMKLVVDKAVPAGAAITAKALTFRRGDGGIPRHQLELATQFRLKKDRQLEAGDLVQWQDLEFNDHDA